MPVLKELMDGYYGLNCVLPQNSEVLRSYTSVPQNVIAFGDRTFKEIVKLK